MIRRSVVLALVISLVGVQSAGALTLSFDDELFGGTAPSNAQNLLYPEGGDSWDGVGDATTAFTIEGVTITLPVASWSTNSAGLIQQPTVPEYDRIYEDWASANYPRALDVSMALGPVEPSENGTRAPFVAAYWVELRELVGSDAPSMFGEVGQQVRGTLGDLPGRSDKVWVEGVNTTYGQQGSYGWDNYDLGRKRFTQDSPIFSDVSDQLYEQESKCGFMVVAAGVPSTVTAGWHVRIYKARYDYMNLPGSEVPVLDGFSRGPGKSSIEARTVSEPWQYGITSGVAGNATLPYFLTPSGDYSYYLQIYPQGFAWYSINRSVAMGTYVGDDARDVYDAMPSWNRRMPVGYAHAPERTEAGAPSGLDDEAPVEVAGPMGDVKDWVSSLSLDGLFWFVDFAEELAL